MRNLFSPLFLFLMLCNKNDSSTSEIHTNAMKTADFSYHLPEHLIAQRPLAQRDASRLLVLGRENGRLSHHHFTDLLDYLNPGDILVLNDSRVIPARLYGRKASGGKVELLLLGDLGEGRWKALVGGKKMGVGAEILLERADGTNAVVIGRVTAVLEGPSAKSNSAAPSAPTTSTTWVIPRCPPTSTNRSPTPNATRPSTPGRPVPAPRPRPVCTSPAIC
jgi:hypothetical protein